MRPTPATDQADRGYAANVFALRFHLSKSALEREAVEVAMDLTRLHFCWAQAMRGETRGVA